MVRHFKSVAMGTAAAALAFSLLAGASAAFGSAARSHSNAVPAFQIPGRTSEMAYVPLPSCVLMDTRLAGGAFGNGTVRNYDARGSVSFAAQGGSHTGCGIPNDAAVLAMNILAVTPSAAGHVKVNAYKGVGTGTIALYYATGQTTSGSLNVDVAPPGSHVFTITNLGGPTQITADVTGYYIAPMSASIGGDGTLIRGSRVVGSSRPVTGLYIVIFDRDLTNCYYTATPVLAGYIPSINLIVVNGNPDGVKVEFHDTTGTAENTDFFMNVTC